MSTMIVKRDEVLMNKNGFFPHNSFIGKPWGLKVYSEGSDGFVRIIRPTAELWTLTLPHRTQVIYQPDISLAILLLELCPGKTAAGRSLTFHALNCSTPSCLIDSLPRIWHWQRQHDAQHDKERRPRGPCLHL